MIRRVLLVPVMALALLGPGCSGNGGSSGTGISQLTGNVSSLDSARRQPGEATSRFAWVREVFDAAVAHAQTTLQGIRVTIGEFGLESVTDAGGSFQLSGRFAGPLTVSFERPNDGVSGTLQVRMPLGGHLVLEDVRIGNGRASPAARRLAFEGILVDRNCPGNAVFVASRFDPQGPSFEVRVDTSSARDRQGRPVNCDELVQGNRIDVRGFVEGDGRIGNAEIEVPEDAGNRTGEPGDGSDAGASGNARST